MIDKAIEEFTQDCFKYGVIATNPSYKEWLDKMKKGKASIVKLKEAIEKDKMEAVEKAYISAYLISKGGAMTVEVALEQYKIDIKQIIYGREKRK